MNAEKYMPFDPFARVKELKHELEAAEYSRLALHHKLQKERRRTKALILMSYMLSIISILLSITLLLKP